MEDSLEEHDDSDDRHEGDDKDPSLLGCLEDEHDAQQENERRQSKTKQLHEEEDIDDVRP